MTVSKEVLQLLSSIVNSLTDRRVLAEWLAKYSLALYQSGGADEKRIVADLDAALGEVQRGAAPEEHIYEVCVQLIQGLRLHVPGAPVAVFTDVVVSTGTCNTIGSSSSAFAILEPAHPYA